MGYYDILVDSVGVKDRKHRRLCRTPGARVNVSAISVASWDSAAFYVDATREDVLKSAVAASYCRVSRLVARAMCDGVPDNTSGAQRMTCSDMLESIAVFHVSK